MERQHVEKRKLNNKSEIVRYIFSHKNAAKSEIAKELGLSMPTVLQNTKELIEQGILMEGDWYESTGGRRAKALALNPSTAYAVGLDIAKNHISMVLVNYAGEVLKYVRREKECINHFDYYRDLSDELDDFLSDNQISREQILGTGIALPGIIDNEAAVLIKSHVLNLEGVSLKSLERFMPFRVHFENDANAALLGEQEHLSEDGIYLFIGSTIGGAFRTQGKLFRGTNQKAGEFGHMILVPGGRECNCGKRGCVNQYCSAKALETESGLSLGAFMKRVEEKDPEMLKIWDEYLDYLAIMLANLRMIYDTEIVLAGDVGECLEPYMADLGERVMKYNRFDSDYSYLKTSFYKGGAAVGAALHFIYQHIANII